MWPKLLLTLVLVLSIGCVTPVAPEKAENGAICMTAEMLQKTMDAACNEGYANGYQKAKAEQPVSDLKLYQDKEAIQELMDCTLCERCVTGVPDEEGDPQWSCMDRASCLLSQARDKGYLGYLVVMNFTSDKSHAIVMFPTKEDGNVFTEPWFDEIVPEPIVGKQYLNYKNIVEKVAF